MSRSHSKGDFTEDPNDNSVGQEEEDAVYKAKTFWSGQGDNDLTVLPNDTLETKAANFSKPGCIYVINRRTGAQGFVPSKPLSSFFSPLILITGVQIVPSLHNLREASAIFCDALGFCQKVNTAVIKI